MGSAAAATPGASKQLNGSSSSSSTGNISAKGYQRGSKKEDDFFAWPLPDISIVPGEKVAADMQNNYEESADDFHEGTGDVIDCGGVSLQRACHDQQVVDVWLLVKYAQ